MLDQTAQLTVTAPAKAPRISAVVRALEFSWICSDSMEQAEAQLITALGTSTEGNLRKEADPADWEN